MAPAADATVRSPVLEHAVPRIAVGPYLRLSGMVRIVTGIREALAHDAARIEIDLQHTQAVSQGAHLLLQSVAHSVRRRGVDIVFVHRVARAA